MSKYSKTTHGYDEYGNPVSWTDHRPYSATSIAAGWAAKYPFLSMIIGGALAGVVLAMGIVQGWGWFVTGVAVIVTFLLGTLFGIYMLFCAVAIFVVVLLVNIAKATGGFGS